MLDLKFIRKNPDLVRAAIEKKGESVDFDRFLALDARRRDILQEAEAKKHERNVASQEIGKVKAAGGDVAAAAAQAKALSQSIKELDQELGGVDGELERLRAWIPNVPHDSVPVGGEEDNVHVRSWGEPLTPPHAILPHYEIGERLGILDTKRASALSGSGFVTLIGDGARLSRALIRFMLDLHTREHGYTEVATPFIARRDVLFGTGQLPKLEQDMYYIPTDELFLIPTAEVTVTNLYRDETLLEAELPMRLTAHTPCFRREAGTYGKDTRGLQRVHQFDKVELVKFVAPETSYDELESLLRCAEEVLRRLHLPYRVTLLASRDLSFAAAKCYDLETWAPAEKKWLEVSSCSNYEDFQARRIGIRMKRKDGKGSELVHTLNGSGTALPRVMIAILENYQTERGTVKIPDVLIPYMDGQEEITAR